MTTAEGPSEDYLKRARDRMKQIDGLTPELRQLVHEEGWTVVNAFMLLGVKKAKHIRHLIQTVRNGSDAYGNGTRGVKRLELR
jgi:hypothetical protein